MSLNVICYNTYTYHFVLSKDVNLVIIFGQLLLVEVYLGQSFIKVKYYSFFLYVCINPTIQLTDRCLMKLDLFLIEVNILLANAALKLHVPVIQDLLIILLACQAGNDRAAAQATV